MAGAVSSSILKGIGVSEGIGMGSILLLPNTAELTRRHPPAADARAETLRYRTARESVWARFQKAAAHLVRELGRKEGGTLDIFGLILKDHGVNQEIELLIGSGKSAPVAVEQVFQRLANSQKNVKNDYLRERFTVWSDACKQLVMELLGYHSLDAAQGRGPVIVAAREITAFALVNPPKEIKGFVREVGGSTDHASILARAFNIPMIIGKAGFLVELEAGAPAIVDGGTGELFLHPTPQLLEKYGKLSRAAGARLGGEPDALPARTKDGRRIALLANLETSHGLEALRRHGAEGVGLLRSEFLFMRRTQPPSEDEQFQEFQRTAQALFPRQVTVRTADFGGDKLPAFLAEEKEGLSAGLRGIRFCLAHEEFFRTHVRAILRASAGGNMRMMFPLVPGLETLRKAKAFVRTVMEDLAARSIPFDRGIPVGVMIEVPSAAIMAEALARETDFFSIGTNDLLQFTMGISRDDLALMDYSRSVQPSIIQLIDLVVKAAGRKKRPVAVCGELAAQPWAIPLLVGLGIDELSMAASHIPKAKERIRGLSYADCRVLARQALALETITDIRTLLKKAEK